MKLLIYPLCFSLILFSCTTDNSSSNVNLSEADSPLEQFADSLFQSSIDSSKIAGASVLVLKNGEELLHKQYGFASLELMTPIPSNGSFEIGSVTKQFTAAAILKLEEEGKLSLNDDFTQYIEFDTNGKKVTIQNLLDHTSGIPSYTEIPSFWEISTRTLERDTLLRIVEGEDFLFEPGEALIYNNTGYFLLGLIIEKLSEMSYEEYLSKTIFEPLGMNNTYYCSHSKVVEGKVYGYNLGKEGLEQKAHLNHTWPYAAGSLCSTTKDLGIWLEALHGGEFFSEEQYTIFTTPGTLNDGTAVRYAKGLTNFINYGHSEISHGGGINGFLSQATYFPDEKLSIICLVNTTGPHGARYFVNELTWQLLEKTELQSQPADFDIQTLEGVYTGQARGRIYTISVSSIGDTLVLYDESRSQSMDTVTHYLGNKTFGSGATRYIFDNTKLKLDAPTALYILEKQ